MSVFYSSGINNKTAAAKSLQSCPTLCDPIDGSPPGSPVPGILQARTLEWVTMGALGARHEWMSNETQKWKGRGLPDIRAAGTRVMTRTRRHLNIRQTPCVPPTPRQARGSSPWVCLNLQQLGNVWTDLDDPKCCADGACPPALGSPSDLCPGQRRASPVRPPS